MVRSVSFGPGWALTAKTNLSARFIHQKLDYGGDPAAAAGVTGLRSDTVRTLRLGLYWEYTRHLHVTTAWDHGTRASNELGRDFRYNAYMANVRYIF